MSSDGATLIPRREALRRAACLLGTAISAPTLEAVLAGCQVSSKPAAGSAPVTRTLSAAQRATVLTMGEHILPETDTPGARAARVDEFIDAMLTDFYPGDTRDRFLAGLDRVDARARERVGAAFDTLSPEQQLTLVQTLNRATFQSPQNDGDDPDDSDLRWFFGTFKELVLVGYYTSEVGATKELRVNPMGSWRGDMPYADVRRAWA
jgi:gluconate 2-dehydrogenase gamma chain